MLQYAFKLFGGTERHEDTFYKDARTLDVVLCCFGVSDGCRLPLFIILKRKTMPKVAKCPVGVVVQAHPKGWMDVSGALDWLGTIWGKQKCDLLKKPSVLVWDCSISQYVSVSAITNIKSIEYR